MTQVKVSEASGAVLDYLVAVCVENSKRFPIWLDGKPNSMAGYSSDWRHGGPIIERQEIELHKRGLDGWKAKDTNYQFLNTPNERAVFVGCYGPTPLIAAMRCYVMSKLGHTVEVPDDLL